MACCLTPSITAREDFIGKNGCEVTLKLKAQGSAGADIVHIRYANNAVDSEPPIQFTVEAGLKMLVVLVEASKPGALLQLIEVCKSGTEQVIDRFHYDPMNPARGYIVRGVAS